MYLNVNIKKSSSTICKCFTLEDKGLSLVLFLVYCFPCDHILNTSTLLVAMYH